MFFPKEISNRHISAGQSLSYNIYFEYVLYNKYTFIPKNNADLATSKALSAINDNISPTTCFAFSDIIDKSQLMLSLIDKYNIDPYTSKDILNRGRYFVQRNGDGVFYGISGTSYTNTVKNTDFNLFYIKQKTECIAFARNTYAVSARHYVEIDKYKDTPKIIKYSKGITLVGPEEIEDVLLKSTTTTKSFDYICKRYKEYKNEPHKEPLFLLINHTPTYV